ncbi:uncharacterized protein LOC141518878 [Macrotis lagotis]|uniref:uncharacterized protein LOC141518878 n=1 Tax=Macrotis lagotis TaxID=92651 RepID=UPI003D688A15
MGSKLSKEQVFIRDLKLALKDRRVKVKKKDLVRFFLFIDEVCPWFLVTGPEIHPGKWQKVGRDLNQKLKIEGPDAVPVSALSYWGLIRDIVESATRDPTKQKLLSVAESCLRPLSRTASIKSLKEEEAKPPKTPARSPSAAIEIPPSKSLYPPLPSEITPAEEPITFPVFRRNKNLRSSPETDPDSEPPDPGDEAELEEEAARYNNPDWPLASAPPPYLTAPAFLPLGPNAPFTLSLEAISRGGYLLPSEWLRVVQAVLTRGQFLTWKADFFDRCQTIASTTYKTSKGAYEKPSRTGHCRKSPPNAQKHDY